MKRRIFSILMTNLLLISMSSCNDWLNVPVDGQSTADELFEIGDGYRSALHGIYKSMASPTLYGRELQFGIIDFFSGQYDINVNSSDVSNTMYIAAGKRAYKDVKLQPQIDAIWLSAFNSIASANDLIKHIQKESNEKFSAGKIERDDILGEAIAIRAFLHLDMLRLFAPAPINDDGANYIPYVTEFPDKRATHLPVKEVLGKIIADLEEARTLVKPYDFSPLGFSASVSGEARFYNSLQYGMEGATNPAAQDQFFLGRGYRFSYWSITALLARAHQYNSTFDPASLDKAQQYAEEVLEATFDGANSSKYNPFKDERFSFTWVDQPEEMNDIRMVSTLIMGLYNEKQLDIAGLESLFPREKSQHSTTLFIINRDGQDIFKTTTDIDETTTDIRSTRLIYEPKSSYRTYLSTKWYVKEKNTKERDRTITILPLLRTSELRYILAECKARKGDYDGAYNIINEMRGNRGLDSYQLPIQNSWNGFMKDLVREGQREWISEGQLFYLYKRLNAGVKRDNGTTTPLSNEESILPMPAAEMK